MASFEDSYHFHHATIQDADAINQLESQSYPADEAATYDKIVYRIKNANEYFYVLKKHNELVGFINGTCIMENTIHHESMSHHHPEGKYLVIHSVTVRKEARRQKIASKMLRAYVHKIADLRKVKGILLMSKSYLLPFYLQVGFNFVKVSPVVHGAEQWNELAMDLQDHFGIKEWVVDAFAARPFTGNPAAVVLVQRDDQWMQSVATENNYAETSFVQHLHDNHYSLRWFTPACEVELCGHATLAAAHVLYETQAVPISQPVHFHTKYSGELIATGTPDMTIELSFPETKVAPYSFTEDDFIHFLNAFGFTNRDCIVFTGKSIYDLLVEVTTEAFYSIKSVNYSLLEHFKGRGVLVTTVGGKRTHQVDHLPYDFISRGFFPLYGISEDPVTGSAHCALASYWFEKFGIPREKDQRTEVLVAYQASKRGGEVKVSILNDRVILGGKGITTMTAKVLV